MVQNYQPAVSGFIVILFSDTLSDTNRGDPGDGWVLYSIIDVCAMRELGDVSTFSLFQPFGNIFVNVQSLGCFDFQAMSGNGILGIENSP